MGSAASSSEKKGENERNSQSEHSNSVSKESKSLISGNDGQSEGGKNSINNTNDDKNDDGKVNSTDNDLEQNGSEEQSTISPKETTVAKTAITTTPTVKTTQVHVPATEKVEKSEDGVIISLPNNSDKDLSKSNRSNDKETNSQDNRERVPGKENVKVVEENQENNNKRKEIETRLKRKLLDLKRDYKKTEVSPSTIERACEDPHFTRDPSQNKEKVLLTSLVEKLKSTKKQKAQLLNRLSELASVRLRHNNPDIADLSDENRATKLAEKLSELYDNEWTDLFEATKKQNTKKVENEEKSIAEGLRDVLKFCYEQCQQIASEQRDRLCSCLTPNQSVNNQTLPQGFQMRLKEFQKVIPKQSLPHIKKTITKQASEELKKTNIIVKHSTNTKKRFSPYIDLCIDISWHTQIQDPPLKLDFDSKDSDLSNFRPYTCTGPQLDYVLWPALLLHEKGSVVAKGVAQFKAQSEIKNESTEEQRNADSDVKVADADWNNYQINQYKR